MAKKKEVINSDGLTSVFDLVKNVDAIIRNIPNYYSAFIEGAQNKKTKDVLNEKDSKEQTIQVICI